MGSKRISQCTCAYFLNNIQFLHGPLSGITRRSPPRELKAKQISGGIQKRSPPPLYELWRATSGRQDSNLRPPAPKAGALTGLRHAPKLSVSVGLRVSVILCCGRGRGAFLRFLRSLNRIGRIDFCSKFSGRIALLPLIHIQRPNLLPLCKSVFYLPC